MNIRSTLGCLHLHHPRRRYFHRAPVKYRRRYRGLTHRRRRPAFFADPSVGFQRPRGSREGSCGGLRRSHSTLLRAVYDMEAAYTSLQHALTPMPRKKYRRRHHWRTELCSIVYTFASGVHHHTSDSTFEGGPSMTSSSA
jgi:hypothetical protein